MATERLPGHPRAGRERSARAAPWFDRAILGLTRPAARDRALSVLALALLLVWPAVWNAYPIVFADTGTYLSQAIHRYLGWDRPAFYSLFMLPLHLTLTPWPVVAVQALLAAWVLSILWRVLAPARHVGWLVGLGGGLTIGTWLPWLVSELMPDIFTTLVVLVFGLLALAPDRLGRWERRCLMVFAAFMIATQLSSVALWGALMIGFLVVLAVTRTLAGGVGRVVTGDVDDTTRAVLPRHGGRRATIHDFGDASGQVVDGPPARAMTVGSQPGSVSTTQERASRFPSGVIAAALILVTPLALALLAQSTMNLLGHGRFSPSPFGNVFQLARLIADGPAAELLRARCPAAGWRLCAVTDRLPSDSDIFLWEPDSPILDVGGHKAVSAEAGAIIGETLRAYPWEVARFALRNTLTQLGQMRSGDGLEPWPRQVTPWIEKDFPPASVAAYRAARQQAGTLAVPGWIDTAHTVVALGGVALAVALTVWAWRRSRLHAAFLLLSLLALPLSAAITGALSMSHDRYQARVAFLPALVCAISAFGLARARR